MLRKFRRKVFETNSSSTHSISIYKWKKPEEHDIPSNSSLEVTGYVSGRTEITDEVSKLNYIVVMLASLIENDDNFDYDTATLNDVINYKWFVWLKEIVKEQRNTDIVFKTDQACFPFFETTYDEGRGIKKVLDCDIDDKTEFKTRITSIIFEPDMIIEDKENEY